MKNGVSVSSGRMPGAGCPGLLFCEGVAACQSCGEKFSPSAWVGSGLGCQMRWGCKRSLAGPRWGSPRRAVLGQQRGDVSRV